MCTQIGDLSEETLPQLFATARKNLLNIENHDARTSNDYRELIDTTIETLERISLVVGSLHLFSENEEMDEVSTESIKFLLTSAFQGFIHQHHYDYQSRRSYLLIAREYYKDFHHICEVYKLAKPFEMTLDRMSNPVTQNNRAEKIYKAKQKKELEEKIAVLEKRDDIDEDVQRDIYISMVRLWVMRCEDEVYNINSELPILEHMEKMRNGEVAPLKPPKVKAMKPFILVKSEQQKRVFGAGYPSLPTMTLDEYYDKELKRIVEEQNNAEKPGPEPEDPDEETEEGLAKARAWDEYRDTHKRGWGNRHNRS
eukprot:sb/3467084/